MIEVKGARKELGEFSLRGVDLRIESGEYWVVLGPTGAGKTVLIECIAGLHRLDAGEVWLEGRNVTDLPPELRNVGYVPQDYVLFPHLSLWENIAFSLTLRKVPRAEADARVRELAELFNIGHLLDRRPRGLSGGEQQRGALARALAPRPTVLLLDEPLSALDEGTRGELSGHLARISDELGTTVIHVCHNFEEALELADRIAILHAGRVLQVGTPAEVFRKPANEFLARFVGAQNLFPVTACDQTGYVAVSGGELKLRVETPGECHSQLAMIRPEEIGVRRPGSLESGPPDVNVVECRLGRVEDRGRSLRLHLEGPVPLLVTMTPQAFWATGLNEGDQVLATFSPASVHLIPHET